MALFDRFHENNSKSKIEDLRKLQCVDELYGQVNSQVAEQLHKSFNSNKRFLNAMSPHNFAYLLRSMLNHRNELRNSEFVEKQKCKGYDIYRNELGRIRLKLGFDSTFNNSSNIAESGKMNNIDFSIGKPSEFENDSNGDIVDRDSGNGHGGDLPSQGGCEDNHDITDDESRNIFDILNEDEGRKNNCENISFQFRSNFRIGSQFSRGDS
jgi:hypothetical protein